MEVLTLINTNPELLNGLVFGPEESTGKKTQVLKIVLSCWMVTKAILVCQLGTQVTAKFCTSLTR